MPKLAANFSMMFGDVDILERFEVAARIGFRGAEIQNPYGQTSGEIAQAYRDSGLEALLFNMSPGVGAVPGREADFETVAYEYRPLGDTLVGLGWAGPYGIDPSNR